MPVTVHIEQGQFSRHSSQQPYHAGKSDGVERTIAAGSGSSKPDFVPIRGPGDALNAVPSAGKSGLFSRQIDGGNGSAVVAELRVVDHGNDVCLGRDANVTNPAIGLVKQFSGGKFEAMTALLLAHDG